MIRKFLIDHNIPKSIANWLQEKNFDVKLVKDVNPELSDQGVLELAQKENRILVTNDHDFVGLAVDIEGFECIIFGMKSQKASIRIQALEKLLPEAEKIPNIGLVILE